MTTPPSTKFSTLASPEAVERTVTALKNNGIEALFVPTGAEAKKKLLELIPTGAEVFNNTSMTLEAIGVPAEINESGRYNSIRKKFMAMDRTDPIQAKQMRQLGAAADYVIGSVHAVTEAGEVLIASNTGSQLGSYAYAGGKVIWVVGSQKIVKDIDEGIQRIYEHSLPLENERAQKAYGRGSFVSKILIVNREVVPMRITLILVGEKLGF